MEHLFVYGTLMPGESNSHLLSHISGKWQRATVQGIRFDSGVGEATGYPGLVLTDNGKQVQGHVLSSCELTKHWRELDEFEGSGYIRVLTEVKLENHSALNAYVYVLHPSAIPEHR